MYLKKLTVLVLIKTAIVLMFILYGRIHLGPDEAQYWTWSQDLSIGYYSKPPGVAYQIWLGTSIFGNNELGVRAFSLLAGVLTPLILYHLARACQFTEERAFWSGAVWALSPIGFIGSLFAITDVGLVLFWSLACYLYMRSGVTYKLGPTIAFGALFKWPIYALWIFTFFDAPKNRKLFIALAISLLGIVPSLIWNYQHDFVTFKHVGATMAGGSGDVKGRGNPLEFVGAQIALFSPIFFCLFFLAYFKKPNRFLALTSLPIILLGVFLSLFMKIQGNWCIFAYPTAALLAAYAPLRTGVLKAGALLSLALVAAVLTLPLPYRLSPFKHNLGWDRLGPALVQAGYNPQHDFLFADSYQTASELSFYGPGQKRAYFFNLQGTRLNQFSFWPTMKDKEIGHSGYFVLINGDPTYLEKLKPYFEKVEYRGSYPLYETNKTAAIFYGESYNGKEPSALTRY